MALKRKIAILEKENQALKESEKKNMEENMTKMKVTSDDRNWMTSLGASQGRGAMP